MIFQTLIAVGAIMPLLSASTQAAGDAPAVSSREWHSQASSDGTIVGIMPCSDSEIIRNLPAGSRKVTCQVDGQYFVFSDPAVDDNLTKASLPGAFEAMQAEVRAERLITAFDPIQVGSKRAFRVAGPDESLTMFEVVEIGPRQIAVAAVGPIPGVLPSSTQRMAFQANALKFLNSLKVVGE